jgi:hypothetical protein
MERRSRPNAPGNGVKNGPRARQKPLRGEEFFPGAKPIEALDIQVTLIITTKLLLIQSDLVSLSLT